MSYTERPTTLAQALDNLTEENWHTERQLIEDALREAVDLLDNARCDLHDPSLRRRWAARRKALRHMTPGG